MLRDDYKQKQKLGSCDTWENEEMKNQKCSFLHMLVKVDLNKTPSCWCSLESEKTPGSSQWLLPHNWQFFLSEKWFVICFSDLFISTMELFYDSFSDL